MKLRIALRLTLFSLLAAGISPGSLRADPYTSVTNPVLTFEHARIVDGLGHPAIENQTLIVKNGKIFAFGADGTVTIPAGSLHIDLTHRTLLPGLVMVHEHLFYTSIANGPFHANEMEYSFPKMYLAAGVTSIRTCGSLEPYADLNAKADVDAGRAPGPKMHLTLPYLDGEGTNISQVRPLTTPAQAIRMIDYWADEGFTSAKVYVNLPAEIMGPAIAEAHRRGLQVTGHIGKVSYKEAADLGIDNLEHGFMAMSDFIPNRKAGDPSNPVGTYRSLEVLNPAGPEIAALMQTLIAKHVAITSTLAIFETFTPGRRIDGDAELAALAPSQRATYLSHWAAVNAKNAPMAVHAFAKTMALEVQFYRAGGFLVVGTDPTGYGGVMAGYGNWRAVELLVEAGLTPIEAIKVATNNGAKLLGIDKETGSIEVGKAADLIVIAGNPADSISDLRKAETVFKDGVGYDSKRLFDSVAGSVGIQ